MGVGARGHGPCDQNSPRTVPKWPNKAGFWPPCCRHTTQPGGTIHMHLICQIVGGGNSPPPHTHSLTHYSEPPLLPALIIQQWGGPQPIKAQLDHCCARATSVEREGPTETGG